MGQTEVSEGHLDQEGGVGWDGDGVGPDLYPFRTSNTSVPDLRVGMETHWGSVCDAFFGFDFPHSLLGRG